MKRYFSILFALICFLSSSSSFAESNFFDLSVGHSNSEAIEYVHQQGIVSGYPDGSFRPEGLVNRAEFTKILVEATFSADKIERCKSSSFPDVSVDEWFAPYVCMAKSWGLVDGYPDESFRPDGLINFAEAAKIVAGAFKYSVEVDSETWYKPFVVQLESRGAIPSSVVSFSAELTRGELAEVIYRLKKGVVNKKSRSYVQLSEPFDFDKVLAVFVYLDEPLDAEIQQQYIGDTSDPNTLKYFETWIAREADSWGQNFRRELVIYPEQIKVPEEFALASADDGEVMVKNSNQFEVWLTDNYPEMQPYDTIGIIPYDSGRNLSYHDYYSNLNYDNQKHFFYVHIQRHYWELSDRFAYYPPLPSIGIYCDGSLKSIFPEKFTHEFHHSGFVKNSPARVRRCVGGRG